MSRSRRWTAIGIVAVSVGAVLMVSSLLSQDTVPYSFLGPIGNPVAVRFLLVTSALPFAAAAIGAWGLRNQTSRIFLGWYALVLMTVAIGRATELLAVPADVSLYLLARVAYYAAGVFMLIAVVQTAGAYRFLGVPLSRTLTRFLHDTGITYQSLVEISTEAMVALDPDGTVRYWNPAAERLLWPGVERHATSISPTSPPRRTSSDDLREAITLPARPRGRAVARRPTSRRPCAAPTDGSSPRRSRCWPAAPTSASPWPWSRTSPTARIPSARCGRGGDHPHARPPPAGIDPRTHRGRTARTASSRGAAARPPAAAPGGREAEPRPLPPEAGRPAATWSPTPSIQLDEAIEASRSLAVEISPPVLERGGLGAALAWLREAKLQKYGLTVEVEVAAEVEPEPADPRSALPGRARTAVQRRQARGHRAGPGPRRRPRARDAVAVEVRDDGSGCDPDTILKKQPGQTGFGLFSIAQRLEALGGKLHGRVPARAVAPRVVMVAPLRRRTSPRLRRAPRPAPQAAGARRRRRPLPCARSTGALRILVADDHEILRQGVITLLDEQPDFQVVGQTATALETLAAAGRLRPDLVVLDVSLERPLSGVQATRDLVAMVPGVVVVGLTMHDDPGIHRAMRAAGAFACITKGGTSDALIATLRAAAASRTPRARSAASGSASSSEKNAPS